MISIESELESSNTRPKIYRRTRKIIRKLAVSIGRRMWKLEISGKENVPASGPFLIAPVHRSNVDFLLAALITELDANFMAKDSLWKIKPLGRFMEHMGAFPVSRGKPDRHSLKIGQQVLSEGGVLVLFPEGTRRTGDEVVDLFEGAAFLANRTMAPVVPVGIAGSDEVMPKGAKMIKAVPVNLSVGKPLYPKANPNNKRVPRSEIAQFTNELQVVLQDVQNEAVAALNKRKK